MLAESRLDGAVAGDWMSQNIPHRKCNMRVELVQMVESQKKNDHSVEISSWKNQYLIKNSVYDTLTLVWLHQR